MGEPTVDYRRYTLAPEQSDGLREPARSKVKRLLDELRWRVEEHHCDGENLDGDELEAFHAVEALLID